VEFSFDVPATGRAARVTETPRAAGGKPTVFEAAQPFVPSATDLAEYAGVYRSEEVEPIYRFVVENDKLVLRRLKLDRMTLDPLVRDTFSLPVGTIRFVRDATGRVSGLTLSTGRVLNFRFSKQFGTT
jgi:hypothetical protein